jgi:hypothetical protein
MERTEPPTGRAVVTRSDKYIMRHGNRQCTLVNRGLSKLEIGHAILHSAIVVV